MLATTCACIMRILRFVCLGGKEAHEFLNKRTSKMIKWCQMKTDCSLSIQHALKVFLGRSRSGITTHPWHKYSQKVWAFPYKDFLWSLPEFIHWFIHRYLDMINCEKRKIDKIMTSLILFQTWIRSKNSVHLGTEPVVGSSYSQLEFTFLFLGKFSDLRTHLYTWELACFPKYT